MKKFVNRQKEKEFLEKKWKSSENEVIVLYGRRRTGKTELINTFIENKNALYFLADEGSIQRNIDRFAEQAATHFDDIKPDATSFPDVFRYINKRKKQRIIIAIDEFSYLVDTDKNIPSTFQRICDTILENTVLILCGSSISLMEEGALSYESPLYGRRTGQWKLTQLSFKHATQFYPSYTFNEKVKAYAVFGGTPAYTATINPKKTVLQNIEENILTKGSFLYEEPQFLLRQSLREPARYIAILEAISIGKNKPSQIASHIGIQPNNISTYLTKLQQLELITRKTPITTKKPKRPLYTLKDNFLTFYFKHVWPNKNELEQNQTQAILKKIQNTLHHHEAHIFEQICREFIREKEVTTAGSWWWKQHEIDVVATDEDEARLLLGECKWTTKPIGISVYESLKEKAKHVRWKNNKRTEEYALFSRNGFTDELIKTADDGVKLFTSEDLHNHFTETQ